jgi:chorismate--pyruvate lyase
MFHGQKAGIIPGNTTSEAPFLMLQDILPLSLQGSWDHEPSAILSDTLSHWLFESGSLTQKLKCHCEQFRVEILAKSTRQLSADEAILFDCQPQNVQVREVLLYCDQVPWVYAQSLMPLSAVPESVKKLTTLGNQPLGEVIFNEPGMTRSRIEVAEFDSQSDVAILSGQIGQPTGKSLWARRSCFTIDGYSLLVAEVFLPDSGAYL